jgi:universal stress protein F
MYQTILVPVDIAQIEKGKPMIDLANSVGSPDCKIVLFHVIEDIPAWVAAEIPDDVLNKPAISALKQLKAIANTAGDRVTAFVRKGHSSRTILSMADEIGAELIIIASHKPGLQDYFLGSTASKVVRHAKCSVLVVR